MKESKKQECTVLFKVVDSESVPFWREHGFRICGEQFYEKAVMMEKVCNFEVKHTYFDRIAIITHHGKKGVGNMHGDILLPCDYDRIDVASTSDVMKVCNIHFVARKGSLLSIFYFDGDKPILLMEMNIHASQKVNVGNGFSVLALL